MAPAAVGSTPKVRMKLLRQRSAVFRPLQCGSPFGVRSWQGVVELKRNKFRAPIISRTFSTVWFRLKSALKIWVLRKGKFRNDFPANEMFLNNALQNGGRTRPVPDAVGINDRDGTLGANAQAIGFGAIDERMWADEFQFLQTIF